MSVQTTTCGTTHKMWTGEEPIRALVAERSKKKTLSDRECGFSAPTPSSGGRPRPFLENDSTCRRPPSIYLFFVSVFELEG